MPFRFRDEVNRAAFNEREEVGPEVRSGPEGEIAEDSAPNFEVSTFVSCVEAYLTVDLSRRLAVYFFRC